MVDLSRYIISGPSDKVSSLSSRISVNPKSVFQQPIPPDQWPLWAKALAQFAKPEDKGIGDAIARIIGDEQSEKFKAWYLITFGKKCGCNGRQTLWNIKYPLNSKAT